LDPVDAMMFVETAVIYAWYVTIVLVKQILKHAVGVIELRVSGVFLGFVTHVNEIFAKIAR
jgi:hypothetical protein